MLRLVAALKENGNYQETKKEHFFAGKGWFHRSEVWRACVSQSVKVKHRLEVGVNGIMFHW